MMHDDLNTRMLMVIGMTLDDVMKAFQNAVDFLPYRKETYGVMSDCIGHSARMLWNVFL